ncbi:3-demethylubiquinone-9 3-methyltransferase [Dirofilaria immitis]|nr:3-demethylubiquinone-9 3-methyltransferase [Dirofilaria immitis]
MKDFPKRLLEILNDGMLCLGLVMGHQLQLFDALAAVSLENKPATCTMIAEKADMRERYVREWLCLMVCGKIIEVDESGEKFWMKEDRIEDLCGDNPNALLVFQQCVLMCAKAYPAVIELFRKDGPLGTLNSLLFLVVPRKIALEAYSWMENKMFDEFDKRMAAFSETTHKEDIINKFVPVTEMQNKLEEGGIQVLDVGCGRGMHIAELESVTPCTDHMLNLFAARCWEVFPEVLFTGIDLSLDAIVGANKIRDEANAGLDNVSYMQMNGQMMKDEWTEKFDWVIMFDACHDQTRPDREMDTSTFMYGMSLSHCLPVGMNSEEEHAEHFYMLPMLQDAMGLGAMWGCEKAKQLLGDAGFRVRIYLRSASSCRKCFRRRTVFPDGSAMPGRLNFVSTLAIVMLTSYLNRIEGIQAIGVHPGAASTALSGNVSPRMRKYTIKGKVILQSRTINAHSREKNKDYTTAEFRRIAREGHAEVNRCLLGRERLEYADVETQLQYEEDKIPMRNIACVETMTIVKTTKFV